MGFIEYDGSRFAQKTEMAKDRFTNFIDTKRGKSVEIQLPTMYLINAYADILLTKTAEEQNKQKKKEEPLVNHNKYFSLPQGTDLEIVKQEIPDSCIYRNIYYTDTHGICFVYRSIEKNDITTAKITSTTSCERDVFQIEGNTLLKVMKGIERSMERKEKTKKVIELFRPEKPSEEQHEHATAA